jgi:hypothetical protein
MLFPTSRYRLTTQTNAPTILKRESLRVTFKFQSQLHFTRPEAMRFRAFFWTRRVPPELGEAIRALPKRIPQGDAPQSD